MALALLDVTYRYKQVLLPASFKLISKSLDNEGLIWQILTLMKGRNMAGHLGGTPLKDETGD